MQFSACNKLRYNRLKSKFSTKMCRYIEVVSSDDNDDDVDVRNAGVEAEIHEITTYKALTLLDKLVNLMELNKDERASLSSIRQIRNH